MKLSRADADLFVPDAPVFSVEQALARTSHLCVAAYQHGLTECYSRSGKFFTGVIVTDGAGSPREFTVAHNERLRADVAARLAKSQ